MNTKIDIEDSALRFVELAYREPVPDKAKIELSKAFIAGMVEATSIISQLGEPAIKEIADQTIKFAVKVLTSSKEQVSQNG